MSVSVYHVSCMSMYKVQEVRELRTKDAKVWTVTALSNMLQVKPLAIL